MPFEREVDGLSTALARRLWLATQSVRLTYHGGDDALVAEFVQGTTAVEFEVQQNLLLEFDGIGADAMLTQLTVTGVNTAPDSSAAATAHTLLGDDLWAEAEALFTQDLGVVDVVLEPEAMTALRESWRTFAPQPFEPAIIGVEIIPGLVSTVLIDRLATTLDTASVTLDANDAHRVAVAVAELVDILTARNSGADRCPVVVQLGGPVEPATGKVLYYDKPLHEGDEVWKDVPLGEMIEHLTGRPTRIYNDAQALANFESRFGLGRELGSVAVLVVRRGVGAKLLLGGQVADFPMEIGIFVSHRSSRRGEIVTKRGRSIQDRSGTGAIIQQVARLTGVAVENVEEAAALVASSPAVLDVFWRAGSELASGAAAIQALLAPDAWVIYGPDELVDSATPTGRAFLGGLRTTGEHLDWDGLRPGVLRARSTSGSLGARAAAVTALGISS